MYVDFQMASHACPALDLTYLLAASTTSEVRQVPGESDNSGERARRNQLNHLLNVTSGEARPPGPPADSLPHHTLPHTGEAGEQADLRV